MEEEMEGNGTPLAGAPEGTKQVTVTEKTETSLSYQALDKLDSKQVEEIWDGRRHIAWIALWAMIIPTLYIIGWVANVDLLDKMGDLMSWFYLAMASIVCAYFGFTSWASIKGK